MVKPVGTQLRMPGLWDDFDEGKAQFPQRITPADIAKCAGKTMALDVETTGLQWWNDEIIGLGVWCPEAEVYGYIPALSESTRIAVKQLVRDIIPGATVRMHNAKFDFHFLGVDPTPCTVQDPTTMIHLYDSRLRKAMKFAEEQFLGESSKRSHLFKAPKKKMIWEWPIPIVADYCTNDVRVTDQLADHLLPKLEDLDLTNLFLKEMEFLKAVWHTERRGIVLDQDFVAKGLERFSTDQVKAEQELFKEIGYEFKWTSPQKLSKALYEDYGWERPVNPFADADGVDRTRFAETGKYNKTLTDSFILMEKAKHPLGALVLHLRETAKMASYLQSYSELMDDEGIIHAGFNINGTRTGRLSCRKPNLQNVPSEIRNRETQSVYSGDTTHRIEEYNLRRALVARPDYSFLSIDYKQMEMRMFGILAQEPNMMEMLKTGEDIHANVSHMVWGTRNHVQREWAKTVGFGLIYGMTLGSLQFRLDVTREKAHEITGQYWGAFPRIKPWLNEMIEECKHYGYVRYWSGRIWKEHDPMHMFKGANAVIQGGCADLLSVASLRCLDYMRNLDAYIVNYVHDELLFEVPTVQLPQLVPALSDIMEVPDLFGVPFFTSAKTGPSYGELVPWEAA